MPTRRHASTAGAGICGCGLVHHGVAVRGVEVVIDTLRPSRLELPGRGHVIHGDTAQCLVSRDPVSDVRYVRHHDRRRLMPKRGGPLDSVQEGNVRDDTGKSH